MTSVSLAGSLRFAANVGMLFQEHAFLERFRAAADAGFEAVEFPRTSMARPVSTVDSALRTNESTSCSSACPAATSRVAARGRQRPATRQ